MPKPSIDKITTKDLRDTERLKALYVQAVERNWWVNNDVAVLEFFMYAEKALHDDKQGTPAKLFYHLIKDKQNPNVTQAMENAALLRVPSYERQELVARAGGLLVDHNELQQELFGEKQNIGFMHSVMVQCFLPQKPLPEDTRRFVSTHGKASLVVEAGILANPETPAEFKECVVPYGSHTRLILPWINRYALQHKTREIDMGASLRAFMEKVGRPIGGYNGKKTTENIEAIGAAQFILGEWSEQGATTKYGRVAQEVSFWIERDPNQHVLWNPSLVLSEAYYDTLRERPMPLDLDHLAQLTKSPMAMDLYSWLSYRLPSIRRGRTVRIPLRHLQEVFGRDITNKDKFTQTFKRNLNLIGKVYRDFDVSIEKGLLILRNSLPPVTGRNVVSLPSSV